MKDAEASTSMKKVDTLVVDKTGTLTEGKPALNARSPAAPGFAEDKLLGLAASLEQASEHPLGQRSSPARKRAGVLALSAVNGFESVTGRAYAARSVNEALIGNARFLGEAGIYDTP